MTAPRRCVREPKLPMFCDNPDHFRAGLTQTRTLLFFATSRSWGQARFGNGRPHSPAVFWQAIAYSAATWFLEADDRFSNRGCSIFVATQSRHRLSECGSQPEEGLGQ